MLGYWFSLCIWEKYLAVGLCDVIINGNGFFSKESPEVFFAVKLQDLKRSFQSINKFCETICLGFEWGRKCISACTLSLVKGKTWSREEQISSFGGILL